MAMTDRLSALELPIVHRRRWGAWILGAVALAAVVTIVHAAIRARIVDLGVFPADEESRASGINDAGVVIGWSGEQDGLVHAVRWVGGQVEDLGHLTDGKVSMATAINGAGYIAGWSGTLVNFQATLWTDEGADILDTIPGDRFREAHAINASGVVAGSSSEDAVIWESGTLTQLGGLAEG